MIPYITIDNFFETPTLVRDFALRQEYFKGDRGNWPGIRTEMIDILDHQLFHVMASKLMSYLPKQYTSFTNLESTFQIIDGSWGSGWVHDDDAKYNVAGLIYLTPDPPRYSGTSFYDFQMDTNGEDYTKMFEEEMNDSDKRNAHEKYRMDHRSKWTENIVVENRFNRCNIFNSKCWHAANNFFGNSMVTNRLTLVFFGEAV